jgi:hypothetical protein
MDWQIAIDVELWKDPGIVLLDSVLTYAQDRKDWLAVMFSDRLYEMIPCGAEGIWSTLSKVNFCRYDDKPQDVTMSLTPDLTKGLASNGVAITEGVAYAFGQTSEPLRKVYGVSQTRNVDNADELLISLKNDGIQKAVILHSIDSSESILACFNAPEPKLNQQKHIAQQERNIGGKIASAFKAWDQNDETYAKELLKKAYREYGFPLSEPKELYTWDSENERYVKFRNSRNWEYHGYDVTNYNEVPDNIKERHHHWKK